MGKYKMFQWNNGDTHVYVWPNQYFVADNNLMKNTYLSEVTIKTWLRNCLFVLLTGAI